MEKTSCCSHLIIISIASSLWLCRLLGGEQAREFFDRINPYKEKEFNTKVREMTDRIISSIRSCSHGHRLKEKRKWIYRGDANVILMLLPHMPISKALLWLEEQGHSA